jgi:positive regulator of sigma E activity
MMTARGRVVAIAQTRVQVRIDPAAGCGSCGSRGACAGGQPQVVWIDSPGAVHTSTA